MVKLLLRHKADPNFPATGRTPLHEVLIGGHAGVAKILIEAVLTRIAFRTSAWGKSLPCGRRLAADPSRASRPDGAGRMPLDYAAASGELKIAELLLDRGAPVVDYDLSPIKVPLHYAIQKGSIPFVELLLKAGALPNTALGWRGESPTADPPLHMAIRGDHREIVKLLLAYKADLKNRDTYSQMPLHCAAVLGKAEFVELLLQAGADVKATTIRFDLPCGSGEEETPQYNTPLHFAAASGNPATIKALLAGGADIEARNVRGNTPLISALEPPIYTGINDGCQLQNIELLLISGAKVNAENKDGRTASISPVNRLGTITPIEVPQSNKSCTRQLSPCSPGTAARRVSRRRPDRENDGPRRSHPDRVGRVPWLHPAVFEQGRDREAEVADGDARKGGGVLEREGEWPMAADSLGGSGCNLAARDIGLHAQPHFQA